MVGSQPVRNTALSSATDGTAGIRPAPAESVNSLQRLTAKVRLAAALRSPEPPVDPSLTPFYVETLEAGTIDATLRANVCRAVTCADAAQRRYVSARVPYYIEAVCAFPDDERCVLFVLALLHQGVLDPHQDLPFSEGVYAAALYYAHWESGAYRALFGLPPYSELRRALANLYMADGEALSPERTALVERVYEEMGQHSDAAETASERQEMGRYLTRAHRAEGRDDLFVRTVQSQVAQGGMPGANRHDSDLYDDPLDSPEAILRGGNGEADDSRIAQRYVMENRPLDAAACALFHRMLRYAEAQDDVVAMDFWTVKLAHALIAVGRVDEETRDILRTAATLEAEDPLLELAYIYGLAHDSAGELVRNGDAADARRLERIVIEKASVYKPLADRKRWDWATLERALALSWGHRGRTDAAARALYKQALENSPEDKLLAVLYARALAQAQIFDKAAVAVYERAMELGKATDPVKKALARAYAKIGAARDDARRPEATRLWEEMYRTGGMSEDPEIVAALVDSYTRDGQTNDVAVALMEKVAKADPKNGQVRLRLGRELLEQGDLDGSVKMFKEAAKLLPEDFEAQYEVGMALREKSDLAGAIRHLKKAVALPAGQRHREAHFALGDALVAAEKRDEARQVLEKIVEEIDSNHSPTLLHLAKLNLRYEETGAKRAEELYEKALAINPKEPEGYKRLASLRQEQGRFAEAETALEQYLALSSTDADAARQLADMYLKRGDYVKAESALRQTVALGGGDKKLFALLGAVITQAQKQREDLPVMPPIAVPEIAEIVMPAALAPTTPAATIPATPATAATAAELPTIRLPLAAAADSARKPARQTLVTMSTVPAEPEPTPPPPDSPAAQNLTRSVGAAAIKAALRNRAARLASATNNDDKG